MAMDRPVHTVSFDAFGTLVGFDRPRRPFTRLLTLLREQGVAIPDDVRHRVMTEGWDLRMCAQQMGATPTQMARLPWEALNHDLRAEAQGLHPFDESLHVLSVLRARGYRLAIVSNLALPYVAMVQHALKGVVFDVERWSCWVGAVKPDPTIFQGVLPAGADPDGVLHVGDTWGDDVVGALAMGFQPVFLQRGLRPDDAVPAHAAVTTIPNLVGLLERLPLRAVR